jgi:hypothetical protein
MAAKTYSGRELYSWFYRPILNPALTLEEPLQLNYYMESSFEYLFSHQAVVCKGMARNDKVKQERDADFDQ